MCNRLRFLKLTHAHTHARVHTHPIHMVIHLLCFQTSRDYCSVCTAFSFSIFFHDRFKNGFSKNNRFHPLENDTHRKQTNKCWLVITGIALSCKYHFYRVRFPDMFVCLLLLPVCSNPGQFARNTWSLYKSEQWECVHGVHMIITPKAKLPYTW